MLVLLTFIISCNDTTGGDETSGFNADFLNAVKEKTYEPTGTGYRDVIFDASVESFQVGYTLTLVSTPDAKKGIPIRYALFNTTTISIWLLEHLIIDKDASNVRISSLDALCRF